ncbi:hypothetical protein GCU60_00505 [Blastococcus saxobsidens]|uniref:O-antigen ligase family protein n=1 Tax=Blastococcus saxobsidens TaxID=138336 RepID=A0A6L9VWW8_9ACTN|nr:hypothetical protein [Blastococcus saxobsidens]NEK84257.1 hypothetical protein [Blastococcus saxobsidens]
MSMLEKLGLLGVAGMSASILIQSLIRDGLRLRVNGTGSLIVGVLCLGAIGNLLTGGPLASQRWLVLALAVALVALVPHSRGAHLGAIAFGGLVLVASFALAATSEQHGTRACRFDKCGPLDVLITGIYPNENALALVLALTLPFLFLVPRRGARDALMLLIGVDIWLIGSRTALLGVAAAAAYWCIERWAVRRVGMILGWLVLLGGVAAELLLPLLAAPNSFTGRPQLWQLAATAEGASVIVGQGWGALERRFAEGGRIEGASAYSLHNQIVDVYFVAGGLGLIFFAIFVTQVSVRLGSYGAASLSLVAVPIWIGVLERPWSVGQVDWLTWSLIGTCLVALSQASTGTRQVRKEIRNVRVALAD